MTFQLEIDHVNEARRSVQELPDMKAPDFAEYEPDLEQIKRLAEKKEYDSLVVIGNGGSITSFRAYLYAFLPEVDVDVRPVTTMDPDFLNRLHHELQPENTLVMPISKSGETPGVIEATLYFMKRNYDVLPLTSDNDGALREIAERREMDTIDHPDLGGRFSGLAETALAPAVFAGIDADEIRKGGEEMYGQLSPENNYNAALNVASAIHDADEDGYDKVFAPFYSSRMFGYLPLLIQLVHETASKEGRGTFITGDHAPEFQHHTNQRIFGGPDDVLPFFFRTENHEREHIEVPDDLGHITLRDRQLRDLEGMELGRSLRSEFRGVKDALEEENHPSITLTVTELSHRSAGKIVAFLQYMSVYLAYLYDVNPYSQPDVERAKSMGFDARFRGL